MAAGESVVSRYLIICLGGLEGVAAAEAAEHLRLAGPPQILPRGSSDGHAGVGKLLIATTSPPEALRALRSAQSLVAFASHASGVCGESAGLEDVAREFARADWPAAIRCWRAHQLCEGRPAPERPSFRASAVRDGSHAFGSVELAGLLGERFGERYQLPVRLTAFDLEAVAILHDGELTTGVALRGACARGWRGASAPRDARPLLPWTGRMVTLRPSVAWTLATLANIAPGDVVIDAMGGVGTVPIEVFGQWRSVCCLSGELDQDAAALAASNARFARAALGERARLSGPEEWERTRASNEQARPLPAQRGSRGTVQALKWDATRLPLRPGCVDAAIVDLPFGQRCLSLKKLQVLYPRALAQLARALRVGGRAVLLTLEAGELERALGAQRALWTTRASHARVHIGCFARCVVYVLERTSASFDEWNASAGPMYGTQPLSKANRARLLANDAEHPAEQAAAAAADGARADVGES